MSDLKPCPFGCNAKAGEALPAIITYDCGVHWHERGLARAEVEPDQHCPGNGWCEKRFNWYEGENIRGQKAFELLREFIDDWTHKPKMSDGIKASAAHYIRAKALLEASDE